MRLSEFGTAVVTASCDNATAVAASHDSTVVAAALHNRVVAAAVLCDSAVVTVDAGVPATRAADK